MAEPKKTSRPGKPSSKELNNPLHDEILLWLRENLEDICKTIVQWEPFWSNETIKIHQAAVIKKMNARLAWIEEYQPPPIPKKEDVDHSFTNIMIPIRTEILDEIGRQKFINAFQGWSVDQLGPVPDHPDLDISFNWQQEITQNMAREYEREERLTTIGYADLHLVIKEPRLEIVPAMSEYIDTREMIYFNRDGTIFFPRWEIQFTQYPAFYFIVMATIPSVAALIRDCHFYQKCLEEQRIKSWFMIVSPDRRFSAILADSGIGFMEYPKIEIILPDGFDDD